MGDTMKRGIDISHHNTITDLSGYDFVIIRAGYGTCGTDRKFYDHVDLAITQAIPFGLYWFIYARNEKEAHENALKCIEVCSKYKDIMQLPLYSDFEYDSENRYPNINFTGQLRTAIVNTFNDTIEDAGFKFGTYTNVDYLKNKFTSALRIGSLWLAQWSDVYDAKYQPDIWQYTNRLNGENLDGDFLVNATLLADHSNISDSDMVCYCPVCGSGLKLIKV